MIEHQVVIETGAASLSGDLVLPSQPHGAILFAHGSGSSRHSPRNRYVAEILQAAGFATLLIDLLTVDEERVDLTTSEYRFDMPLLAERLGDATDWLGDDPRTSGLALGYFGASTGAAAALVAAAGMPHVGAVVSRGGRPDLAENALEQVKAPTLLVVGSRDVPVIEMNRSALERLGCEKRLEIVEGATHLFEERGTLEQVADLARDWFRQHLGDRA